ncbi:MAG: diacylglycerol/lipid kinase family protein [Thermoanaerobaculaceae bacterium]
MFLVVNPAAGGGKLGKRWSRVEKLLKAFGLKAPSVFTEAPGHATELAAKAVAQGAEAVIAAGGDGTVCEVAEGLQRAGGGVLGVLPLGTGNDTARTLGIPHHLRKAIDALRSAHVREIDLIKFGPRVAVNAVGIGILGAINVTATRFKKVRGITAYLAAALTALLRYRSPVISLQSDSITYTGPMTLVAIQNGPTTGGGFRLAPGALPDDGCLNGCLVEDVSPLQRLISFWAALRGTLGGQPGSHSFAFSRLQLTNAQPLPAHLDGNPVVVPPGSLEIRVLPKALRVLTAFRATAQG